MLIFLAVLQYSASTPEVGNPRPICGPSSISVRPSGFPPGHALLLPHPLLALTLIMPLVCLTEGWRVGLVSVSIDNCSSTHICLWPHPPLPCGPWKVTQKEIWPSGWKRFLAAPHCLSPLYDIWACFCLFLFFVCSLLILASSIKNKIDFLCWGWGWAR